MIRIDNVKLHTGETVFVDGCVLVDGDKILYAGERGACPKVLDVLHIDGHGGIVMPGFYNAHSHAAMVLMRGVGTDLSLMDWLDKVLPIEAKLTGKMVFDGTMLAICEMLRRGVVAFADSYCLMDHVAKAAIQSGIRANVVRGCSDRDGVDSVDALHREFNGAGDGRIKVFMGLHAEYTSTEEVARYAIERARALDTGFHVHMSETKGEVEGCYARRGASPVAYFDRVGAFEGQTIAAHCVHLSEEDVQILAEKGVYAVHNPSSNLKLASGIAPVAQYLKAGVRVALGTDGASSNNVLDMLGEMRLASILQKGAFGDPTLLPAREAIRMATRTGALAMGYTDCGLIEAGMQADLILLDGEAENMMPCPDVDAAIVYAAQGLNVRMTMVQGRVLYKDGAFTTLDFDQVQAHAREAGQALSIL